MAPHETRLDPPAYTDNDGYFSRRGRHHEREKSHKRHSPRNKEHEEKFEAPPQPPPQQPLQYPPPPEAGLASMIDNHAKVRIHIIFKAVNSFSGSKFDINAFYRSFSVTP